MPRGSDRVGRTRLSVAGEGVFSIGNSLNAEGESSSPGSPSRILAVAVNWLGDLVMSLPALKALRQSWPDARLTVLVASGLASFFDGAGWVDEVLAYRRGPARIAVGDFIPVVRELSRRRFDLAVLFPNNFESALIAFLAGAKRRAGYRRDGRGLLLTDGVRPTAGILRAHQSAYFLRMIEQTLAVTGRGGACVPEVFEPHRESMREKLAARRVKPGAKLVALAAGAAFGPAKQWPAESFAALIDLLCGRHGAECVLVGSAADRESSARAAAASREGALVLAGETSVGELLALLSLCDAFAGNDSGSMHVAGALEIPTVGLFGSTDPRRTGPLGARTSTLWRQLPCSPCLERTCRFGHYDCLKQIRPEEVAAELESLGVFP